MRSTRIEQVLEMASVRELRRLFDESPEAVVTVGDAEGRLWWASRPGSVQGFGREPSSFIGQSRFDYIHPDDRAQARRVHGRALEGETVRYVTRARTAGGDWVTAATVAWREDLDGEPVVVAITTPLPADEASAGVVERHP